MIRINLVDYTPGVKHIDFQVVPVTNDEDFACVPDGILPLRVSCGFPAESRMGVHSERWASISGIG